MNEFKLDPDTQQNGVYILSEIKDQFESIYLKIREIENRICSEAELAKLPFASNSNPHRNEWNLRAKSFLRFKEYLKTKNSPQTILDMGCGNGWFSGKLANEFNHKFYCVDVNLTELMQGAKVFNSANVKFIYADIFTSEIPTNFFNLIVLNASVQYFIDINKLLNLLLTFLTDNGEIHIIDSPFYSEEESHNAKQRTLDHYSAMNCTEMAKHYYHHTFSTLLKFKYKLMHNPSSLINRFKKLLLSKDTPFPWIVIKK